MISNNGRGQVVLFFGLISLLVVLGIIMCI